MSEPKVTRGYGLLENFLSKKRGKLADGLISPRYRNGRILDIGCGMYPHFLINIEFHEKYGLDKIIQESRQIKQWNQTVYLINHDINKDFNIPFDKDFFDVVTMLAVIEHIEPKEIVKILRDINRVLKPGGLFILTTPAAWTDMLLRLMAKLKLVSSLEIEEHKSTFNPSEICSLLHKANFAKDVTQSGYFEMFMNIWATSTSILTTENHT